MYMFLYSGRNNVSVAHILFRNLQDFLPNDMYVRDTTHDACIHVYCMCNIYLISHVYVYLKETIRTHLAT